MKPSLRQIIATDWPALASAIGIPVSLLVSWLYPVLHPSSSGKQTGFAVVGASACLLLLMWRTMRVVGLFRGGQEVEGTITRIQLAKDRGRIEFGFCLDGNAHRSWQPVHQSRRVLALSRGQRVRVLVDPRHPGRAIIRDLFERPADT